MEIETTEEAFDQASQMASRLVENALSGEQKVEREATTEGVYTLDVTHHLSHFAACYHLCKAFGGIMPAVRLEDEVIPVNFLHGLFAYPLLSLSAPKFRLMYEFPPFRPAFWKKLMEGWDEQIACQEAKDNVRNSLSHFLAQRIGVMNWIRKFGAEALPPQAGTTADGGDDRGSGGTPNGRRGRGGSGGSGTASKTTYFTVTVQTQHPGISISSTPCYLIDWSAFGGPTRPIPGKAQHEADGQLLPGKHYFGGTGSMVPSFTQDPTVFKTPPSFRCYLTAV